MKPFYNDMIKKENQTYFKRLLEMTTAEYLSVTSKLNWNATVKYSLSSIISDPLNIIHLCHLLAFTACKLKVFGEVLMARSLLDAKVGSIIVNYLLKKIMSSSQ